MPNLLGKYEASVQFGTELKAQLFERLLGNRVTTRKS
jgi:hypothetical protein